MEPHRLAQNDEKTDEQEQTFIWWNNILLWMHSVDLCEVMTYICFWSHVPSAFFAICCV